jgi:hypothetical protein
MHRAVLLVNGRSAVRIRSPAPRSERVSGLCLSRLVERTLRAGAACRHSGYSYGRWRMWHPSSVGPHHDAVNAQPAEHPEDPQWILRELPDRERANFLAAYREPWTVREIRPDGDIRGGMLLGIASDCAVPRNQRHPPEPLAPGDDRHAGREVGHHAERLLQLHEFLDGHLVAEIRKVQSELHQSTSSRRPWISQGCVLGFSPPLCRTHLNARSTGAG